MDNIIQEGYVKFWIHHDKSDWLIDGQRYDFDSISEQGITVVASKLSNRSIQLVISGPYHQTFTFTGPIPITDTPAVMVTFVWKKENIKLYLGDKWGHHTQFKQSNATDKFVILWLGSSLENRTTNVNT